MVNETATASGTLPYCALKAVETVSGTTISHHIESLEAAGLIEVAREGKFALLAATP
jgi:DNA-binding transcriptional ArsR family regulator